MQTTPLPAQNDVLAHAKSLWEYLANVENWIGNVSNEQEPLAMPVRCYRQEMELLHNHIKIFGMQQAVPLRNVYVRVNILERISARNKMSLPELEKFHDRDQRTLARLAEAQSAIDVVEKNKRLVVLGKPGAGKTTLLKYIALAALDGKFQTGLLPLYVPLKTFSDFNGTLIEFIVSQLEASRLGSSLTEGLITHLLNHGKCIVLFDAYDEVSSNSKSISADLRVFCARYSSCKFVLTCRVAAYTQFLDDFTEVEIADFTEDDVRTFAKLWFSDQSDIANMFLQKLFAPEARPIKELAATPLLLTLLCMGFASSLEFQSNKSELYKEAIEALLKKWDASRGIRREEIYRNLSLGRKEQLLSHVAAETFEKGEYFFAKSNLETQIGKYIQHLPETKRDQLRSDSEAVLRSIEAQHGLLVERAEDIYSFSHLTFQEYFAARYIVNNQVNSALERLITAHLFSPQWHEVITMISGMLPDAEQFLKLIRSELSSFANHGIHESIAFSSADIKDVRSFSEQLTNGSEPVSIFLAGKLSDATRELMRTNDVFKSQSELLQSSMSIDIDAILRGECIYDEKRFDGVVLRPETKRLIDKPVFGAQNFVLNRLLLEDAYSRDLIRFETKRVGGQLREVEKLVPAYSEQSRALGRAFALAATLERAYGGADRTFMEQRRLCEDLITSLKSGRMSAEARNVDWDGRPRGVSPAITEANKNIRLVPDQSNSLYCYLYGTKLLLECLNADCYLKKSSRMLLIEGLLGETVTK